MQQTTRIAGQRMSRESEFIWTITDARVRAASVDHEDKVEAARNLQLVIAGNQERLNLSCTNWRLDLRSHRPGSPWATLRPVALIFLR